MTSGQDVAANLAQARTLIEAAAADGAELIVLPENFAFMGANQTDRLSVSEHPGSGPIQDFLSSLARDAGAWLIGGTVPLRCEDAGRAAAACLTYDPRGELAARYDKIHLFDVSIPGAKERYRESASTAPGSQVVTVATDFGGVGLAVCYDIRFPALFDCLGRSAMDILAVPAAFTVPTGEAHWHCLLRARCIESLCFGVAAAQWGEHPGGRSTYGHSLILGPWGDTLAELTSGAGVCAAEVDIMSLTHLRERFPALEHRRELSR
jgi:nitrilase